MSLEHGSGLPLPSADQDHANTAWEELLLQVTKAKTTLTAGLLTLNYLTVTLGAWHSGPHSTDANPEAQAG